MGQAFDHSGNVLGEAFGDTKREVFDKLMAAHKDAAEIRVRSLESQVASGPSAEMPKYRCHKEVWALKIEQVIDPTEAGNESDGSRLLRFEEYAYAPIRVSHDYVRKHNPQPGGYYVVYDDGYKSFSPAQPFESGYTRI